MDVEPAADRSRHDTNLTPNTGHDAAAARRSRSGGPQIRAAAAAAQAGAARRSPRRSLGVPVASLTRRARASSRAAARPSPTAQLIGDKLFNVRSRARGARALDTPAAVAAPGEAGQPVQARRHRAAAARRHPGQGRPARTPTSTTSASRACCTAASSGRAARAPTATARRRRSLSVDESSISAHPGRAGRAQAATSSASSRRRSTTRSRRRRS